jgi:ubiquinone biosynthesis protein COQ4
MRLRNIIRPRLAPLPGCAHEPGPLPAQLPPRAVQWRRLWRLLAEIRSDPARTDKAFEMFEAVGGRGDDDFYLRFVASVEGRALLEHRSCLASVLGDRAALAALPEDTLGRAYLAFAQENGFAADGLIEIRDAAFDGLDDDIGPDRQWFFDRLTVMHDLWHVLTEYGTDADGEIALLGFSRPQGLRGRAVTLFVAVAALTGGKPARRCLREARRRGLRAGCLVVQPWEELLPLPIAEVRARLGIAPAAEAHPGGIPRALAGGFLGVPA